MGGTALAHRWAARIRVGVAVVLGAAARHVWTSLVGYLEEDQTAVHLEQRWQDLRQRDRHVLSPVVACLYPYLYHPGGTASDVVVVGNYQVGPLVDSESEVSDAETPINFMTNHCDDSESMHGTAMTRDDIYNANDSEKRPI